MTAGFEIAGHRIAGGGTPFIIAEAGINHNGNLETAFEMIRVAKASGADCIKFQTFKAEEFVGDRNQSYEYLSQGKKVSESMLEMFRRHEFDRASWHAIRRRCDEVGIVFLSTPQNYSDLELLLELGVDAVKVGSDDFTNLPLLTRYAGQGLPLLVSCGMCTLAEVYQSLEAIGSLDGYPTVLLLCTSQYPTPPDDVNLLKLSTLRAAFPMVPLGFSDHTQGVLASTMALSLGAVVFEKHFTLDHNLPGPDHWFSEDPAGLAEWVAAIRSGHRMLGSAVVRPTESEEGMRLVARRSIVATRAILPGEPLTPENVALRRPGNGLPAALYPQVTTRLAARKMEPGHQLQWGDFA